MKDPCSWRRITRNWSHFFLSPVDPVACDVVRIGYALVVLALCVTTWSRVDMWYGEQGAMLYDTHRKIIDRDAWSLFDVLPHTEATARILFGVLTLQAALLLGGVWCRAQALGMHVVLISLQHRNLLILDAEDTLFRVVGFLLIFMPLGYTLSWDAWRRRRKTAANLPTRATAASAPPRPCWALRLLQIEMCVIFAGCAYSKLCSDYWLDGRTMYYTSRLDDLFGRTPTPAFLWESMFLMKMIGWSVIAIEVAVPVLVWFRETRWVALILAALFHIACDYMLNLYLFHWLMLVGWCSFVRSDEWRWLGSRKNPYAPKERTRVMTNGRTA